jgi:hypothetical protein
VIRRRAAIPLLLVVILAAVATWYHQAPRKTWDRFNRALILGSESELHRTVDFPILRDNLKRDLRVAFESSSGNSSAALGGLAGALIDPMVDATLTPQGMARVLTVFGTRRGDPATESSLLQAGRTSFRYRSPSRVDILVHAEDAEPSSGGIFTLARSGFSWRLVRIWSHRLAESEEAR